MAKRTTVYHSKGLAKNVNSLRLQCERYAWENRSAIGDEQKAPSEVKTFKPGDPEYDAYVASLKNK